MKRPILYFFLLICYSQLLFGQNKNDTIPFILTPSNNIAIPAIFNNKDTTLLMFHMGSTAVVLLKTAIEKMSSIHLDKTANVTSWGGNTTTGYSDFNTLQIEGLQWDSVSITEARHSGKGTDGKFGWNLFEDKIFEINFDENKIILYTILPQLDEEYQQFNIEVNRGSILVEGEVRVGDNHYKNKFMLHSGYGGTLLLDDEFVAKHNINEKLPVISESELKDSYGNIIKTKKATLPALSFGTIQFSNLPIGFFEGAIGRQKMSVIGGDILKRMNIIIDMNQGYIYLKPSKLKDSIF